MREAAQAGFNAAEVDRHIRERAPREHRVHGHRAVGAPACLAAGGVGVVRAALFGGCVVRDHGVDVAAVDEHCIARAAHGGKVAFIVEIRLAEDRDLIACVLQNARDDRRAEGRMVDIRVAGHEQEIAVIPAAVVHILFGNWEKTVHKSPFALQSRSVLLLYKRGTVAFGRRLTALHRRECDVYGTDFADCFITYSAGNHKNHKKITALRPKIAVIFCEIKRS